jgi:hypothetical protein
MGYQEKSNLGNPLFSLYMMKTLYDIYKKYIVDDIDTLDPVKINEELTKRWGEKNFSADNYYREPGKIKSIVSDSARSLLRFKEKDPKFPIKALYIPGEIFLTIDSYKYGEQYLFDSHNPIIRVALIELYKDKFGCLSNDAELDIFGYMKEELLTSIKSQKYWGFWCPAKWKWDRSRKLVKRELEVTEASFSSNGAYLNNLNIILKDKAGKEISSPRGYLLFLTKDLMKEKLEELEILWMEGYDVTLQRLDHKISKYSKIISDLKKEKKKYSSDFEKYKNKIKNIIWKDF